MLNAQMVVLTFPALFFLPLPPEEAATWWRVRGCDIADIIFPSSPALLPKGEGGV